MRSSGGRRMPGRHRRDSVDKCRVVGLTMGSAVCLLALCGFSASFLRPTVRPPFPLSRSSLKVNLDEASPGKFRTNAVQRNLDGLRSGTDENVDSLLRTTVGNVESRVDGTEGEGLQDDGEVLAQEQEQEKEQEQKQEQQQQQERRLVSRVAFGSCTARMPIEQPIWREGVIPSNPHAWIWAGDIAYMDWPDVNCKENPDQEQCNCTRTWLHSSRQTCFSGDIPHAMKKLKMQLTNPDYEQFLHFMCPNARSGHRSVWGDLASCKRPIMGTWDDHDYNWQDGNRRLPTKVQQKQLFLDAFGVPVDSPRRGKERGIHWKHTLNEGIDGKEIDVFLLDERFDRDPKPCHTRRDFCEKVNLPYPTKYKYHWCMDFLRGGEDGQGSCCKKDEKIWSGWCKTHRNPGDDLWEAACNPKSRMYGPADVGVDLRSGNPVRKSADLGAAYDDGVLCEFLGRDQRLWLFDELYASKAPLKLIVSGSPAFNNPHDFVCAKASRKRTEVNCSCYDDLDCYRPAQINLLHNVANAPGCTVVLTGDFHFSDIKALQPGRQTYSDAYESSDLPHPLFQIMASGLTTDTGQKGSCEGFRVDTNGMRADGDCSFVTGPAFGMVEVDWDAPHKIVKLQVRDDQGVVKLESALRLDTCSPL